MSSLPPAQTPQAGRERELYARAQIGGCARPVGAGAGAHVFRASPVLRSPQLVAHACRIGLRVLDPIVVAVAPVTDALAGQDVARLDAHVLAVVSRRRAVRVLRALAVRMHDGRVVHDAMIHVGRAALVDEWDVGAGGGHAELLHPEDAVLLVARA
eukprot:5766001-Prymnesium_polylepis.1